MITETAPVLLVLVSLASCSSLVVGWSLPQPLFPIRSLVRSSVASSQPFLYDTAALLETEYEAYSAVVEKAVEDEDAFQCFKSSRAYGSILEHVTIDQGKMFAVELGNHEEAMVEALSNPRFVAALEANLQTGTPPCIGNFDDLLPRSSPLGLISPTQLRYFLTLLEMTKLVSTSSSSSSSSSPSRSSSSSSSSSSRNSSSSSSSSRDSSRRNSSGGAVVLGRVVEVGCGYGGQAQLALGLSTASSYALYDLPEAGVLASKYLHRTLPPDIASRAVARPPMTAVLADAEPDGSRVDLFISNYAISELPAKVQFGYTEKLASRTRFGYVQWNHGIHREAMTAAELAGTMSRRFSKRVNMRREQPPTAPGNMPATWSP